MTSLSFTYSAEKTETLSVATYEVPPFVIKGKDGEVSGFSIDLLKKLAPYFEPSIDYKFKLYPDMESSLLAVSKGEVDLGIGATIISSKRERFLDFSHTFYRTRLGALVTNNSLYDNVVSVIGSSQILICVSLICLYLLICSHIIWIIERRKGLFHEDYFHGICHGLWWVISTMSTVGYGDLYPRKIVGKVFGTFVIISGIFIFSLSIATFTSLITVKEIRSNIQGISSLVDEPVAAIKNSIASYEVHRKRRV